MIFLAEVIGAWRRRGRIEILPIPNRRGLRSRRGGLNLLRPGEEIRILASRRGTEARFGEDVREFRGRLAATRGGGRRRRMWWFRSRCGGEEV